MTIKSRLEYNFGWIPDLPDARDFAYSAPVFPVLPGFVDLRPKCPPIYDQGYIGSCTANAVLSAYRTLNPTTPDLSRLFLYYNSRLLLGTARWDSGAMIRDAFKTLTHQGVCPENDWIYDQSAFAKKPPAVAYQDALEHQAISYSRLRRSEVELKACLHSGFPVVFGFSVYENIVDAEHTGHIDDPKGSMVGGHAMLLTGYSDELQKFYFANSWGTTWGVNGCGSIGYNYLLNPNLADDFWTLYRVE